MRSPGAKLPQSLLAIALGNICRYEISYARQVRSLARRVAQSPGCARGKLGLCRRDPIMTSMFRNDACRHYALAAIGLKLLLPSRVPA
jgi:hypothetical protein